ncbi:MAG: thioredoxin [Polyangiaceae bacterium]
MRPEGWLALVAVTSVACNQPSESTTEASATAAPARGPVIEFVPAPEGEPLAAIVAREAPRAEADSRTLLIYVGAPWCEPCTRFHEAATAGKLDGELPRLRLIELDRDRDEARLEEAGCISKLIPLFARATPEGRCDPERQHMGGVKGDGAVPFVTSHLKRLLAREPS